MNLFACVVVGALCCVIGFYFGSQSGGRSSAHVDLQQQRRHSEVVEMNRCTKWKGEKK